MNSHTAVKQRWEASFTEQIAKHAYNTAPVEAVVRTVAYYLRDRFPSAAYAPLRFLEMGCGAGANLLWLARQGMRVSGVDISPRALHLCRTTLEKAGLAAQLEMLVEASVAQVPMRDHTFDGIIEACVFQHLAKEAREQAFAEVSRLLKPGGLFVGYMLASGHTVFEQHWREQLPDDPGTLVLAQGGSKLYLTNIGLSHFFSRDELLRLLAGFSLVDPCLTTYYLPRHEARKRGYDTYLQSMWTVYAIK